MGRTGVAGLRLYSTWLSELSLRHIVLKLHQGDLIAAQVSCAIMPPFGLSPKGGLVLANRNLSKPFKEVVFVDAGPSAKRCTTNMSNNNHHLKGVFCNEQKYGCTQYCRT